MGTFFKSFWREMGRNTGKRVSNAVYGDKWSTPYRARISSGDGASKGKSKRKKSSNDADIVKKQRATYDNSIKINYAPYDPAVMRRIMDMFENYSTENINLRREQNRTYEQRRREADMKVMAVTKLSVPSSEHGLVDMMSKLLTLSDGLNDYGFDKKVRDACTRKYRECYSFLEHEYPESNQVWHYYFINAKHKLSSVSGLVKALLALTAFFVFFWAIGGRRSSDINITIILLSLTFGVPILCIVWQFLRLWYFKRRKYN